MFSIRSWGYSAGTQSCDGQEGLTAVEAFQSLRAPEGLELIWSPSEPGDRMSSAELEVLYPELARLDASVGRVACSHCAAVFARELGTCPACGAPAPAAAA